MTSQKRSPSTSPRVKKKVAAPPARRPSVLAGLPDYPGKRMPVNRGNSAKPEDDWSARPTQYPFNGTMRDFYTIAHLAQALDKSPVTIRWWEKRGVLPSSALRSPRPKRAPITGTQPRGRRLWTREQIEGILRIAKEEHCILNGDPPTLRFTKRITQLFTKLHTQLEKEAQRNAKR